MHVQDREEEEEEKKKKPRQIIWRHLASIFLSVSRKSVEISHANTKNVCAFKFMCECVCVCACLVVCGFVSVSA